MNKFKVGEEGQKNINKQLLFSITIDDFEIQTFKAGGKGGQHQNKTESAVRLIHHPSGAVAESREHKNQLQNKKEAFKRVVETVKFKIWHKIEISKRLGKYVDIEKIVEDQIQPENLVVESRMNGKWIPYVEEVHE